MATINIRIGDDLKNNSEAMLSELGLSMTTAMTLFLKAVVRTKSIPFAIEIPNTETLKAFKEAEDISSGKKKTRRYKSVSELRNDLKV